MCHTNGWDQVMHPVLLSNQDDEEIEGEMADNFERNVSIFSFMYSVAEEYDIQVR
jgi:hypothetical protein